MGESKKIKKLFLYDIFFLIDKKQYIDQKNQEVPKGTQEVNKKEPEGACEEPTNPQKSCQPYLHPSQTKKSTKEFVLSTLYRFAQFHKILKKLDFIF